MKISIVIPTYSRPDLLDRLLSSIAKQNFQDFEVIVVDDNSPNRAEYQEVIRKYKSIFREFTFLSNKENRGAPYSRNRGILIAKYQLIALVDDDDEWLEGKLAEQYKLFEESDSRVGIIYTWTDAIDANNAIVYRYRSEIEGIPLKEILKECFIPSPSVMVRKSAILEAGLFDESFPSCQDWDMWTRIIKLGFSCKVVKKVLAIYNIHNQGNIGKSKKAVLGYKFYYLKHLRSAIISKPLFIYFIKKIFHIYINLIFNKKQ